MDGYGLVSYFLKTRAHLKAIACLSALVAGVIGFPSNSAPIPEAVALDTRPTLDGDVLNDRAWKTTNINQFWQQRPVDGSPASQKDKVFIGYTDRALYIGVVCYDINPEGIIVSDSRRDTDLEDTDSLRTLSLSRSMSAHSERLPPLHLKSRYRHFYNLMTQQRSSPLISALHGRLRQTLAFTLCITRQGMTT